MGLGKERQTDWSKLQSLYKGFRDGTTLIHQGQKPQAIFILISGRLLVERDEIKISYIKKRGDYVGEIGVLLNTYSSATVKTITPCTLIEIDSKKADTFLYHTPEVAILLAKKMADRLAELNANFASLIDRSYRPDLIQELQKKHATNTLAPSSPGINLESLRTLYRTFRQGQEIMVQGTYPNALYILVSGTLEIIKNEKMIAVESTPGYYIGDVSILRDTVSNATVRARKDSILIEIHISKVESFLNHSPEIAISIARKLAERTIAINDLYLDIQKETVKEIKKSSKLESEITQIEQDIYRLLGIDSELLE